MFEIVQHECCEFSAFCVFEIVQLECCESSVFCVFEIVQLERCKLSAHLSMCCCRLRGETARLLHFSTRAILER